MCPGCLAVACDYCDLTPAVEKIAVYIIDTVKPQVIISQCMLLKL